MPFCPMFRPSD